MSSLFGTRILGTGSYLPEKVVSNHDLQQLMETSHEWIYERTGIEQRHIAADEEATSDLALQAASAALANAGLSADQLDLIIVATLTPDHLIPATACIVQDKLGATRAAAFDLEAACSGFVSALAVAHGLISSGTMKHVLVIGAECMSRVINWDDRKTAVLFGDGAGAVVLGRSERPQLGPFVLGSDGSGGDFLHVPAGGSRLGASLQTIEAKQHGIVMDGSEVFKFAVRVMGRISDELFAQSGLTVDDLDLYIPHQANSRIVAAASKRMGIAAEKVFVNLHKTANTSAASIPIALDEANRQGLLKEGMKLMLAGFGAGLTWAGCLLTW